MCEKCAQLNEKIVHCKALSKHITDQLTLDGIAILIGQYEAPEARAASQPRVRPPQLAASFIPMSLIGPCETCRGGLAMSVHRGKPEENGSRPK